MPLASRCGWGRPEFSNQPQNFGEQRPRYRDLSHLECYVAGGVTILASIFIRFSLWLVRDQCVTASGKASVRMKLARF